MIKEALPIGWTWTTVEELLTEPPSNGLSIKGSEQPPGMPALKLSAMREGGFDYAQVRYLPLTDAEADGLLVEAGDFFVSRGNGSIHLVGRGTLAQAPPFKVIYPDTMIRLRVIDVLRQSRWLSVMWSSLLIRAQLEKKAKTTAGIWKLSQQDIASVTLPLPPLMEQHRIVAAIEQHISDIDAGVAAVERALASLKRYRASVLKAACEGRLVPTEAELARKEKRDYEPANVLLRRILKERRARWEADQLAKMKAKGQPPRDDKWRAKYDEPPPCDVTDLPTLPEGWCWATVSQLSNRVTVGHVGPMKHRYAESGVPFLRSQNVRENRFDPEGLLHIPHEFHEELSKSKLKSGDIVVVRSGAVGTACVIPETIPEANCSDLVIIQGPTGLVPAYGAYALNSVARKHIEAGKVGIALTHFNTKSVAELPVPLPPLAEQRRIVAEVDRLLSTADETEQALRAQLARAARLRQAVLKRAFEGKLVPQDPSDEPASALLARLRAQEPPEPKRAARSRPRRSARPSEP